jgi:hypothetical protein
MTIPPSLQEVDAAAARNVYPRLEQTLQSGRPDTASGTLSLVDAADHRDAGGRETLKDIRHESPFPILDGGVRLPRRR